jgi:hypothetical protein
VVSVVHAMFMSRCYCMVGYNADGVPQGPPRSPGLAVHLLPRCQSCALPHIQAPAAPVQANQGPTTGRAASASTAPVAKKRGGIKAAADK